MKKIVSLFLVAILSISMVSCGLRRTSNNGVKTPEIKGFAKINNLQSVSLSENDYHSFCTYLDYDNIDCPYSKLFGIQEAFAEKDSRTFDVHEHTYNFLDGTSSVDYNKLYDVVKANNKQYMDGVGKHFNKELSNSKLKECCKIVADTLNWGIENIDGLDIDELGCIVGNLKILSRGSLNSIGTFSEKTNILSVSPDAINQKKNRNGNADMYEIAVSHEAMHILQCRCTDIEQNDDDSFIGTSYFFDNLEVNPLKISWLYEGSAELNATLRLDSVPTTYEYMIDNIESISLATVLNDDVKARQLEKLCFTQDNEGLYRQFEFADTSKAAEFLYVVELLRNKLDDFKNAYEKAYGTLQEDYSEFLKKTYNPYFVEVVSKLLYKNLALKLTQKEISLNDVFYIISLYELDLLKDIPLEISSVKEKYIGVYEKYTDMQKTFFEYIQKGTDTDVLSAFIEYQMNYENGSIYANASLEWLDAEKREYILFRNEVMYNESHKYILNY